MPRVVNPTTGGPLPKEPTCEVEHPCAVCGGPAIEPGHQKRGGCPDFLVRCAVCRQYKRGKLGQVFAIDLDPATYPFPPGTIYELM